MRNVTIGAVAALGLFASPALAVTGTTLTGDQIQIDYRFRSRGKIDTRVQVPPPVTVGDGIEAVVQVASSSVTIDFDSTSLTLGLPIGSWTSAPYNGFAFTNLTDSFNFIRSVSGIDASRVVRGGTGLFINWQGLDFQTATDIRIDFDVARVPEPATWAIMVLGFGLIGVAIRRRQETTVAV